MDVGNLLYTMNINKLKQKFIVEKSRTYPIRLEGKYGISNTEP